MITTQERNEEMRGVRAEQSRVENKRRREKKEEKRNKRGRETPGESERDKNEEKEDLMRSTGCYSDGFHNKIQSGYSGQRLVSQHLV